MEIYEDGDVIRLSQEQHKAEVSDAYESLVVEGAVEHIPLNEEEKFNERLEAIQVEKLELQGEELAKLEAEEQEIEIKLGLKSA